jgi:hypothetical protein
MRSLPGINDLSAEDRQFVEREIDALLDEMFARASGNEDRFGDMLAHFVAMTVAPSLAATNMILRLPRVGSTNRDEPVRFTISGDSNYTNTLGELESELAEAVTNAVLQTLLGPSPRIPAYQPDETPEEVFLN